MEDNLPTFPDKTERKLIEDTHELLCLYEAMHEILLLSTRERLHEDQVWARELVTGLKSLIVAVTRASLAEEKFLLLYTETLAGPRESKQHAEVWQLTALSQVISRLFAVDRPLPEKSPRDELTYS